MSEIIRGYPSIKMRRLPDMDYRLKRNDFKLLNALRNNKYVMMYLRSYRYIIDNVDHFRCYLLSCGIDRNIVDKILEVILYFNSWFVIKYRNYFNLFEIKPDIYLKESRIMDVSVRMYNESVDKYNKAAFKAIKQIDSIKNPELYVLFNGVKYGPKLK